MNVKEVLGAFLLVNNPIVLSEEETKDVQKAIKQLQQENQELKDNIRQIDNSVDKLQKQLMKEKDNWNKLKEHIEKDYGFYDKLIAPEYGCAMGALSRIKDKMQELEQGSDK